MKEILQKIEGEKGLHRMDEILYYYNYLREGSNMRLHAEGKLEREKQCRWAKMRNLNKKIFFDENAPPTLFESIDIETQRELFKREHLGI